MSETWNVELVFTDARSNKFWRARTQGKTMYVNFGRIGTEGQTQIKELGSAEEARSELEKQAAGKRKKGYVDSGAAVAPEVEPEPEQPAGPRTIALTLASGGRSIDVVLTCDGKSVRTEVSETYASADDAAAAFTRIVQAMQADGYKKRG